MQTLKNAQEADDLAALIGLRAVCISQSGNALPTSQQSGRDFLLLVQMARV